MKRKIVIQGANHFGKYIKMLVDHTFDIVAFVDRNKGVVEASFDGVPIFTDVSVIMKLEYDFILLTAVDVCGVQQEYNKLYQVPYEKMISMRHVHQVEKQRSFAAFANEIARKGICGSVAEVGVDYGDTAKYINFFFPESTLYLFDTFSGFNKNDIEFEKAKQTMVTSLEGFYNLRSNVQDVLNRMFYKEKCVIKEGYFPESLNGLEDTFVFVHIDCDLQKPIKAALEYFYHRLVKGGAILVHDYFNPNFPGVREVVREFCSENNINYTPDIMFSGAVICK